MIVTLRDKTEIHISSERGERLKKALIDGNAPEYIAIDDTLVRKDFIVKVKSGGATPIKNALPQGEKADYRGTVSQDRLAELKSKAFGGK